MGISGKKTGQARQPPALTLFYATTHADRSHNGTAGRAWAVGRPDSDEGARGDGLHRLSRGRRYFFIKLPLDGTERRLVRFIFDARLGFG